MEDPLQKQNFFQIKEKNPTTIQETIAEMVKIFNESENIRGSISKQSLQKKPI